MNFVEAARGAFQISLRIGHLLHFGYPKTIGLGASAGLPFFNGAWFRQPQADITVCHQFGKRATPSLRAKLKRPKLPENQLYGPEVVQREFCGRFV
jgi:hypothetical protein